MSESRPPYGALLSDQDIRAPRPHVPPSSNGYASLRDLRLAAPMEERDLDVCDGIRIRIRMLSRHDQHRINREARVGQPDQDLELAEHITWQMAFVAPAFESVAEAADLFGSLHPAVAQKITDAILDLSGLSAAQQTAAAAAFPPADAGRGPGV